MNIQMITDQLNLIPLTSTEEREVSGVFISDMLSDVMSSAQAGNLWLTVQTHKNIVSAANLIDISAIIVTHDKNVPEETIKLANRFHVIIIATPLSTFDLVKKLIEAGVS